MSSHEQTHYLLGPLATAKGAVWGEESEASLAIHPTGIAVVFVHGFGGSAVGTWLEFPTILTGSPKCSGSDLFFFGYKSKRRDAAYSGSELFGFLSALGSEPARTMINPSLPAGATQRSKEFQFKHIVICAHSLGAVITRLALLDALNEDPAPQWPRRVRS